MVFTAHFDHLGMMGDALFAGANDNASGSAFLLHQAQKTQNSTEKPHYSQVYVFFGAEEAGLVGSRYFVENSPLDLSAIKFVLNMDLMGTGEDGFAVVNATSFPKEFAIMEAINEEHKLFKRIKKRNQAANSDHFFFSQVGVPAFFIYTMGGLTFYHDIYDLPATLPMSHVEEMSQLLDLFVKELSR